LGASPARAACIDPTHHLDVQYGTLNFTQTRHLNGVRAPLTARGQAVIARDGVDWHVTAPFDVRTNINAQGITQSVDGGPAQRVGPQGGGDAFLTSAGLFDLLVGNFNGIDQHYTISQAPRAADGSWTARLTPKDAAMSQFLSYIEVKGCERVEHVEVRQANGDWMEILLSPING
jgi:hypothetical protein